MGAVGLLYVGAVLFLNGVTLLGKVDPKSAGVFNLFVGALQVITPTFLIFTAGGDPDTILNASGIYLFGFTYLYVGVTCSPGWTPPASAGSRSSSPWRRSGTRSPTSGILDDNPFGVIWLYWAFLWFLFFLLFGLKLDGLTTYTGWVTAIQGMVTGAIPAFLLLTGYWADWNQTGLALALGIFGVVMALVLLPLTHPRAHAGVMSGAGTPAAGRP